MNNNIIDTNSNPAQMNMFLDMYGRDKESGGNIFNDWDFHPIYTVSKQEQAKLKKEHVKLPFLKYEYLIKGVTFNIVITPAYIKTKKGEEFFYPTEREEIVELALRKLMMNPDLSSHIPSKKTWVKFSLSELLVVLKDSGHSMDLIDLKESLDIMHKCNIEIRKGNSKSYEGSILLELVKTDRQDYEKTGSSNWAASFNSLVTSDIDRLNFRQVNLRLLMGTKMQISRHVIRFLNTEFLNAGIDSPRFKLKANDVIDACRLKTYKRKRDAYAKIKQALLELRKIKDKDGNSAYMLDEDDSINEEVIKSRSKITDIIFHIRPSKAFIDYMVASNSRNKSNLRLNK